MWKAQTKLSEIFKSVNIHNKIRNNDQKDSGPENKKGKNKHTGHNQLKTKNKQPNICEYQTNQTFRLYTS